MISDKMLKAVRESHEFRVCAATEGDVDWWIAPVGDRWIAYDDAENPPAWVEYFDTMAAAVQKLRGDWKDAHPDWKPEHNEPRFGFYLHIGN